MIHLTARRGQLRPEVRIDSVQGLGARRLLAKYELMARWSEAIRRPKRDVLAALEGERPRVVVVTGVGSVAVDDVWSQLREAEADYDLEVVRAPIIRSF